MKITSCQRKIYDILESEIQNRIAVPGSFLPGERELALRFGVARETIRKVLTHLEARQLITRSHGKGTLVCEVPQERNVISFLVPSPDYFTKYLTRDSRIPYVLYSLVEAVSRYGWRVELLPFSSTNRKNDPDPALFSHLNEKSRVFIYDVWFERIFDYMSRRRVKVGLLRISPPTSGVLESASVVAVIDYYRAVREAMSRFVAAGCRRIGVAGNRIGSRTNEIRLVCLRIMEELGIRLFFHDSSDGNGPEGIRSFCREKRIDALFLNIDRPVHYPGNTLRQDLELPDGILLTSLFPIPAYEEAYPDMSHVDNPIPRAVESMVPALLKKVWEPEKFVLEAAFHPERTAPKKKK